MHSSTLPLVYAGPVLRRATATGLSFWFAVREPVSLRLELDCPDSAGSTREFAPGDGALNVVTAGEHLHFLLLDIALESELPRDAWIGYHFALRAGEGEWLEWRTWSEELAYPGRESPGLVLPRRVAAVLHGSCRKPHHGGGDGLVAADAWLARCGSDAAAPEGEAPAWPSALVLSGDQIYADDVAGPMLQRIHRLIPLLGLPEEALPGAGEGVVVSSAGELYRHPDCYYHRDRLLPRHRQNRALLEVLFGGVEKPVFTTVNAGNHLVTLAEVLVMYLLVWSPALWELSAPDSPPELAEEDLARYREEEAALETFAAGLGRVRRLMAHLPVAMIFDDHDVTDDWNLSREWEEAAYGHPFSARVIGNALLGYLLCQGWGNRPEVFGEWLERVQGTLSAPGGADHDELIHDLLGFDQWHYTWHTDPPLVVADCRTHRWRSESAARRPSGLMDWEALTDLQHELRGLPAVLLVSSAPIFGVKLIEVIQRVFTWFGQPLMVDAENWMSHKGAASAILNIFRHSRTPGNFVILSGDVHYSFVYDVELRGRSRGPDIYQICSSGLRNSFPERLLDRLDRANRWLYAPRSPLNWLTRRRRMRIIPRKPEGTPHGRRLLNACGVGLVELDEQGVPRRIRQLLADGGEVEFTRRERESRWR